MSRVVDLMAALEASLAKAKAAMETHKKEGTMADPQEEFDPFKGETGFKDDYDGVITECWFAQRTGAGDNEALNLYLKVVADDGEEVENRYGIGPDWATYDGGETVEHPKGEKKGFNNNVAYIALISAAMSEEVGAESALRQRSIAGPKTEGGVPLGPRFAELWKGLKFHWNVKTEHKKFKDRETQEWIERDVSTVLPTKFLGETDGTSAPSQPGATAVPATTPPASSAPAAQAASTTPNGIDPGLLVQLKGLAKSKPDFGSFADAAMEIPGVVDNTTIMGQIASEEFYASLKA